MSCGPSPFTQRVHMCSLPHPARAQGVGAWTRLRGPHIELPRLVTTRPGCDRYLLDNRRTEAGARA